VVLRIVWNLHEIYHSPLCGLDQFSSTPKGLKGMKMRPPFPECYLRRGGVQQKFVGLCLLGIYVRARFIQEPFTLRNFSINSVLYYRTERVDIVERCRAHPAFMASPAPRD